MKRMAALALIAAGCGPHQEQGAAPPAPLPPEYLGVQTMMIDDDLVTFRIAMRNAAGPEDVDAYTECAAAQYALIRGVGYAQRVRTNVERRGTTAVADAIYMISAERPLGETVIEAAPKVDDCKTQSIPTV